MAFAPERLVMAPERIEPLVLSTGEEREVPLGPILEDAEPGLTAPGCDPITPRSETVGVTVANRSAVDPCEFN